MPKSLTGAITDYTYWPAFMQDLSRRSSLKSSVLEFEQSRSDSPGPSDSPQDRMSRKTSLDKPEVVVTQDAAEVNQSISYVQGSFRSIFKSSLVMFHSQRHDGMLIR